MIKRRGGNAGGQRPNPELNIVEGTFGVKLPSELDEFTKLFLPNEMLKSYRLLSPLGIRKEDVVWDIGMGNMWDRLLIAAYMGAKAFGVDREKDFIDYCRTQIAFSGADVLASKRGGSMEFIESDFKALTIGQSTAKAVLMMNVLEYDSPLQTQQYTPLPPTLLMRDFPPEYSVQLSRHVGANLIPKAAQAVKPGGFIIVEPAMDVNSGLPWELLEKYAPGQFEKYPLPTGASRDVLIYRKKE